MFSKDKGWLGLQCTPTPFGRSPLLPSLVVCEFVPLVAIAWLRVVAKHVLYVQAKSCCLEEVDIQRAKQHNQRILQFRLLFADPTSPSTVASCSAMHAIHAHLQLLRPRGPDKKMDGIRKINSPKKRERWPHDDGVAPVATVPLSVPEPAPAPDVA